MSLENKYILSVNNLRKEFVGTIALNNISVSFEKGKIHALIGKNGSGKSTFVNIITGNLKETSGEIFLSGEKISFSNPLHSFMSGIAAVHQENSLVQEMSVAENIFLGRWPKKKGKINWEEIQSYAKKFINDIAPTLDINAPVFSLSIGQQQIVEIIKAVSMNPHILILDEPTSALSLHESEILFDIIKKLKKQGTTIIYITHRLQELVHLVDTISILRDGQFIIQKDINSIGKEEIIQLMFGDIDIKSKEKTPHITDKAVLSVSHLTRAPYFQDISFNLYQGEILGIAGMLGSGRTELLRCLFGLDSLDSGEIYVEGEKVNNITASMMKQLGFAFASDDRREEGLIQEASIHFNLCLAAMDKIKNKFYLSKSMEIPYAQKQVDNLAIKIGHLDFPISSLSGGNQQKVVIGNWLNNSPKIWLLDEPSRGIDIQAKQYIFSIIEDQSYQGVSSIMVSSELEELVEVCDRILIMIRGKISQEYAANALTHESIYSKCMEKNL